MRFLFETGGGLVYTYGMLKRFFCLALIVLCLFSASGCGLVKMALSAGIAYGISKALE